MDDEVSPLTIDGRSLGLEDVLAVSRQWRGVALDDAARPALEASRGVVTRIVEEGRAAYGITTGFGSLSDQAIHPRQTSQLQVNLLRSHASGSGRPFATEIVRGAMLLRANSLAHGNSGVRPVLIETLIALLNARIHPIVPEQGSLGASGDLAPLAHLALPLVGEGEVEYQGAVMPARAALATAGIVPVELAPKEALALINGTQIMASLGTHALLDAERALRSATAVSALSVCALAGRRSPFAAAVQAVRPHPGQIAVAAALRAALDPIPEYQTVSKRIQDPYSVRCVPQVFGAIRDMLRPLGETLVVEVNSATDNPLIFAADDAVISGGNFHGHLLALAIDAAKTAVASLGTISERRVALLVDGAERGLPPFLIPEPGVNSGFMIAHYLTAGLVTENRVLAHPSSVDSIPTSAGIEDYNSMGANAARHFRQVVRNVEQIVAVEALCAAQACDLAGRVPGQGPLVTLHQRIRERIPMRERDDRIMAEDVAAAAVLVREGALDLPEISQYLSSETMKEAKHA